MGVNSPTSTITLSLPMNVYEQVELQNDIGNLTLQNVHADRISLKSDTGDMDLQSITGKSLLHHKQYWQPFASGSTDTGTNRYSAGYW